MRSKFHPLNLSNPKSTYVRILVFINDYNNEYGVPPSIRDIQDQVNISSTSVVNFYLERLQGEELIKREHFKSRTAMLTNAGLMVIHAELCPTCGRPVKSHEKEML